MAVTWLAVSVVQTVDHHRICVTKSSRKKQKNNHVTLLLREGKRRINVRNQNKFLVLYQPVIRQQTGVRGSLRMIPTRLLECHWWKTEVWQSRPTIFNFLSSQWYFVFLLFSGDVKVFQGLIGRYLQGVKEKGKRSKLSPNITLDVGVSYENCAFPKITSI
jgi:hypothetical protein